jgi:hypothetical protein
MARSISGKTLVTLPTAGAGRKADILSLKTVAGFTDSNDARHRFITREEWQHVPGATPNLALA